MTAVKNWALATFILCFLVIIAGGIVRTTQSGMGCPDWPTCFGKWIPPTNASELPADFEKYLRKQDIDHTFNAFHTWIEYINRLLGVLLGLFGIIQVALFIRHRKTKPTSFKLAIGFLVAVILTGLFGAIVVRYNLAHLSISVHLFFAILLVQIQLAVLLALQNKMFTLPISKKLRITVVVFLAVLFFHSVLGTMVRMYVDDVSKFLQYKQRDTWLAAMPVAFLIHRSFSWVVLLGAAYIFWLGKNTVIQKRLTYLLGTILLSVIAGITLVYANMPAAVQPLHLLLAAVAITQTVNLLLVTRAVKLANTK
jgi:heme a synthase